MLAIGVEVAQGGRTDSRLRQEGRIKDHLVEGGVATHSRPFGGAEEEQLVLYDRSTDGVAKLVAGEAWLGADRARLALRAGSVGEGSRAEGVVVVRVGSQSCNAVEFKQRSMELVGAGLGGDVNHSARCSSVFRGKVAGRKAEFRD